MLTHAERLLKEKLDSIFGNSPATQELKEFLFKAHTSGFKEEELKEYEHKKQMELEMIKERMKPFQSETTQSEVIIGKIFSNEILGDVTTSNNEECISINARDRLYST